MHATLENPCYCFCHASGNEDECRYCKKVNKIVAKALHQYTEELKGEIKGMKHNLNTDWQSEHKETERLNGRLEGYNIALNDVLSLLERKGEK